MHACLFVLSFALLSLFALTLLRSPSPPPFFIRLLLLVVLGFAVSLAIPVSPADTFDEEFSCALPIHLGFLVWIGGCTPAEALCALPLSPDSTGACIWSPS